MCRYWVGNGYIYLEHVRGWVQGVVCDTRQGEVEGVLAEGGQGQHRLQPVANLHTANQDKNIKL